MGLKLITAPTEEPVTLEEAKQHLRVDGNDEDLLITALIVAAREQAEHLTGRAFVSQGWRLTRDAFPAGAIELPCPPLLEVTEIAYIDTDGAEQVLPEEAYMVKPAGLLGRVLPAYGCAWPAQIFPGSVRIDFTAGYGDAAAVPQSIKRWVLLAVGTWYAQREALTAVAAREMPRAFWDALLDPYRVYQC